MDYSYKLPTEQKTVTGSIVTFNSTYPFPLDACKISFSASQSGTGDPSPTNVRPISGVSSITLGANGSATVIDLDGTRYGGYVDAVSGVLTLLWKRIDMGTLSWSYITDYANPYFDSGVTGRKEGTEFLCDMYKYVGIRAYATAGDMNNYECSSHNSATRVFIRDDRYTTAQTFTQEVTGHYIVYELATPITIQLTPQQLSTIIGNNTFSTDTGTLEIKYQDLQEKSASGAIASFNTALNMPLSKGEFSVTAYQEGSGDPYPAGGSAQIWDEETELGAWNDSREEWQTSTTQLKSKNYIPVLPNTTYRLVNPSNTASRYVFYDTNKTYLSWATASSNSNFTTPNDTYYMMFGLATYYGTTYKNNVSINYPATDTAYHAYSNVRPIHGFSEVNATRAGKNLFDKTKITRGKWLNVNTGIIEYASNDYAISDFIFLKGGTTYIMGDPRSRRKWFYSLDKQPISEVTTLVFTPPYDCYIVITFTVDAVDFDTYQLEAGSEATAYEPYVTPTIYTIQLGQGVYGAEVDVVNGVAHCTHAYYKTTGNETITAYDYNNQHGVHFGSVLPTSQNRPSYISNMSKYTSAGMLSSGAVWCGVNSNLLFWIGILDILNMTLEEFKLWIVDHPLEVAYPMKSADQFDIQLTPTQIETLIGNNNIFCNTGDTSVSYKDLDIAKLGSFREVFKLPVAWKYEDKTASGSVASFRTVTNLPLVNGEFSTIAYQEGTGDPSPVNKRNIVPRREVNIMHSGFNMCNAVSGNDLCFSPQYYGHYTIDNSSVIITGNTLMGFIIPVKPNTQYTGSFQIETSSNVEIRIRQHDKVPTEWTDGYLSQSSGQTFSTYCKVTFVTEPTAKVVVLTVYSTRANTLTNWQCEFGNTMTEFKPFTAFDTKTVDLGEDTYGAVYNSVTGDKTTNRIKLALDSLNWNYNANSKLFSAILRIPAKDIHLTNDLVPMCDIFKGIRNVREKIDGCIMNGYVDNYLFQLVIYTTSITSKEQLNEIIQGHEVVYTIRDVDRIITNIGSTPIETFNGANNIFCDTGDTSVTYRDIDMGE
jgi:hypothetical protein